VSAVVALFLEREGSECDSEMEMDQEDKCVDTSFIESVDGKIIRQLTVTHEEKQELADTGALNAKRSLFPANDSQHEQKSVSIQPSRYDEQIPDTKRVKRSLDYELAPVQPQLLDIVASLERGELLSFGFARKHTNVSRTNSRY